MQPGPAGTLDEPLRTSAWEAKRLHDYYFAIALLRSERDVPFRSHPRSRMPASHYPGTSLSCMFLSNNHYLDFLVLLLHKQSKEIPDRSAGNHCCHCLWQESRRWIPLIGHQMDCGHQEMTKMKTSDQE